MSSTLSVIENFNGTLEKYSEGSKKGQLEKILDNIERILTHTPAVLNEKHLSNFIEQRSKVLNDLINKYFIAAIGEKYPVISDDLFQLKRYLTIEKDGTKAVVINDSVETKNNSSEKMNNNKKLHKIAVPLFIYTPLLDGNHKVNLGKYSTTRTNSYGDRYVTRGSVNATLPGYIGSNLRRIARETLGTYHTILTNAYNNVVLGEFLVQNSDLQTRLQSPEIGAIWIPMLESLNISVKEELVKRLDPDPAMILKTLGKNYLVATWRVDDEEPFEIYLDKYTISKNKKVRGGK